ncbi:hypothetical protein AB205_0179100 [Aquarana catesbeiana]|uniref:Protein kinase domain-containing protein n=1 Tax=Aquarana catesbeiana TaxID=8400 RepID=A0A2G9QIK0_AQUCT|nr:hypothetical protein AB205_0179100 [Aquarana catesbeiana]
MLLTSFPIHEEVFFPITQMTSVFSLIQVFLATHCATKKIMAIKSVVNTSNKRDFIETEPKVLQMAAGCPFLTQLYTTFQTRDYAGFVMEYISGGDLFDFTINHFPLDISFIRFIAVEISCGLDFLQKHVIVHRDIKGNNILLDNKGHVHIADYGVAVMDLYGDKKVTGVAGTIGYMAPELLCKCPNKRLGVSRDVRRHPFMRPIDWKSLEQGKGRPPFSVGTPLDMDLEMHSRLPPSAIDVKSLDIPGRKIYMPGFINIDRL